MVHCTACEEGHVRSFNHSMADQFTFGSCGLPNSFFKLNWAFGHKWSGENAHAGVRGKGLTCQKVGSLFLCQILEVSSQGSRCCTNHNWKANPTIGLNQKKFQIKVLRVSDYYFESIICQLHEKIQILGLCNIIVFHWSIHFWYFMNSGVYEA